MGGKVVNRHKKGQNRRIKVRYLLRFICGLIYFDKNRNISDRLFIQKTGVIRDECMPKDETEETLLKWFLCLLG